MRRVIASLALIVLLGTGMTPPVIANDPDYDVLGRWSLPWACDEGHRVSWDPQGHWEHHKARGIAYDFAMAEGTPLVAPADGLVRFLRDDRPLETNYGNYVDIIVAGGQWLIRLAHLRDAQTGIRWVRSGDLVGYAGKSGVQVPHLHLEILVRHEGQWISPDLDRIEHLFGLPIDALREQALVTREGCPVDLTLAGSVRAETVSLGEMTRWLVPLRNLGLTPLTLCELQLWLRSPQGEDVLVEADGEWVIQARGLLAIGVPWSPSEAGAWAVRQVIYSGNGRSGRLGADGGTSVSPSAVRLLKVSPDAPQFRPKDALVLHVVLQNSGDQEVALGKILLRGVRPDGRPWQAAAVATEPLSPGASGQYTLTSDETAGMAGRWRYGRVAFEREGRLCFLGEVDASLQVSGAALRTDRIVAYEGLNELCIFLQLTNIGTESMAPAAVEVWGWKPDGIDAFIARQQRVTPLSPGQSLLLRLAVPTEGLSGPWQMVEAGYWVDGSYFAVPLPSQPTVWIAPPSSSIGAEGEGLRPR